MAFQDLIKNTLDEFTISIPVLQDEDGVDYLADVQVTSSDQSVVPDDNIAITNAIKITPVGLGVTVITMTGEVEDSFELNIVRPFIDPSKADLTDTDTMTTLTFEYPAQLQPLIYDAFWTHYKGTMPATEEQKAAVTRAQVVDHIIAIVNHYGTRMAEQFASKQSKKLKDKAMPHVKVR